MNHPILQYTPQFEQDLIALHTGNVQARNWFYQSVINILENPNLSSFTKADQIADAFISLDSKLDYIVEQQRLLASLKKQIEIAKELAKEEVSKALLSFGVTKLEGMKVSSITASKKMV